MVASFLWSSSFAALDVQFWLLVVTIAGFLYVLMKRSERNLVPMPYSRPIIGNSRRIPKREPLAEYSKRWSKEIGSPVIRLRFGMTDAIVLNDWSSIQEALIERGDDYAGRPYNTVFDLISEGYQNVAFADASPGWRRRRKIMMAALRTFSVGGAFEDRVATNWKKITESFDEHLGENFDPSNHARLLITNYQSSVCFGKTFNLDDPDFKSFKARYQSAGRFFGRPLSVDKYKILRYLPVEMADHREAKKTFTVVGEYVRKQVQEHIDRFDANDVRDFTDHLLKAKQEAEEEEKEPVSLQHLSLMVKDIFAAGMATQQTVCTWLFHQLAMHPDAQQKAYDEIMDVIGDRQPTVKDRSSLPYCDACVQEITRFSTSNSVGVPRKTLKDTEVCGYFVPKGTTVYPNISALHFSPDHFPEPLAFKPERFLTADGRTVLRPRGFLPFGAGRRVCAGETAGRATLFLVFVHLLQTYRLLPPDSGEMKYEYDFRGGALPFKIRMERRN